MEQQKCQCKCKNPRSNRVCEGDYVWNPATCSSKIGKYLPSIIEDLVIICDETIEEKKNSSSKFYSKKNNL